MEIDMKRAKTLMAGLAVVTLAGIGQTATPSAQSIGYNFFDSGVNSHEVKPSDSIASRPFNLGPKLDRPTHLGSSGPGRGDAVSGPSFGVFLIQDGADIPPPTK
jgi:hypothetical protein